MGPGAVQATANITIAELTGKLRPTGIRVFPDTAEVDPRESVHLVALAVDANGVAIPNMKFDWEILEPLAGSIAGDGRLTAGESVGTFPGAIRVTLIPEPNDSGGAITTSVDVRVVDPDSVGRGIFATVLPQVISLIPKKQIKFTSMVMDRRGNQMSPSSQRWEVLDPRVGVISEGGRLVAGEQPGIYPNSVRVSMVVPDVEDEVVAMGTVIIVEVAPPPGPEPRELARVAIFPDRVVLSPGESTRVSIVGLSGDIQRMPDANIRWSLVPPEVAEVSQFVTVTAHNFPGIYEGAIRAEVQLRTEEGLVTQEVSATLVIRDSLATAEVTPGVATLANGEKVQFRAAAYDKNGIVVPDAFFRWSVTDETVGSIDPNGVFTAKGPLGEYPGVVLVEAIQRLKRDQ